MRILVNVCMAAFGAVLIGAMMLLAVMCLLLNVSAVDHLLRGDQVGFSLLLLGVCTCVGALCWAWATQLWGEIKESVR